MAIAAILLLVLPALSSGLEPQAQCIDKDRPLTAVASGDVDASDHLGLLQLQARGLAEATALTDRQRLDLAAPPTGGLKAEFFYLTHSPGRLADVGFDGRVPDLTRVDPSIAYKSSRTAWEGLDRVDNFAARWTGALRVEKGGTYTLALLSDDGSSLTLDGEKVLDNDGIHPMRLKHVQLELNAGDHPLKVLFFERAGGAGIYLSYKGPDTNDEREIVPSGALVPSASTLSEEAEPLTPPAPACPSACQAPSCISGDFTSGGWLLDDGVCTVTCSEPNHDGIRQCGRGAAFESSDDSIDCSKCVKVEEQCGQCVLWGDPHIVPFDRDVRMGNGRGANVNLYNYGDYWIVRSSDVHIQGRYWSSKYRGNSMTRGLAVGGPFLQGNVLMIEPLDGTVEWSGEEVVSTFPSSFQVPTLVYMRYHNRVEVVRTGGTHQAIHGLDIQLPLGVQITVNRFEGHLDVLITMHQLPGGIDGHCGNCNHDAADDTTEQITQRFGGPVEPREDLFPVKSYTYIGCYIENPSDRDLSVKKDMNMNDEECALACIDYKYFGIYGNGECWCSDQYGKHGEADGCNCPHANGGPPGAVGGGKQCIYSYFDSEQPPVQTLDDCDEDLKKKKAEELCGNAYSNEEVKDPNLRKLCMSDVCFGAEEFAEEDAWAATEMMPCASLEEVQTACGKPPSDCSENGAGCDMSDCVAYESLGWFDKQIRLLKDGQALGTGELTSTVLFENREGLCISDKGTLHVCTTGQCLRTGGPSTTTTTTSECKGGDCTFWGDPHIHSFDKLSFDDVREGDMWLVKSHRVWIQGRFGHAKQVKRSFLKGIAVGGPFLMGNNLTLTAGEGYVYWNKQTILEESSTEFETTMSNGKLVRASFRNAVPNINDPNRTTHGIDVSLPDGVRLIMDRFQTWLGLKITLEHSLKDQDGICGNFNNVTHDDSVQALARRMDAYVDSSESLFHMSYARWEARHSLIAH
mmetsp:Transcript_19541/g.45440  ORF Transcript_19541/g.45440 Transcript_19541/m.45440 type:complete len:970 (+) Transcript_19541:96-3005(+)